MEVNELQVYVAKNKMMAEYEEFLRDLQENPLSRFNLSLSDNGESQPSKNPSFVTGEDASDVPLVQLLKGLVLIGKLFK